MMEETDRFYQKNFNYVAILKEITKVKDIKDILMYMEDCGGIAHLPALQPDASVSLMGDMVILNKIGH